MSTDTRHLDDPATDSGRPTAPTSGRSRRRVITFTTIGVVIVLIAGLITWWGVARSHAQDRAEALIARVNAAEVTAQDATRQAAELSATLIDLNDAAISRVLALVEVSPDLLSPDIVSALREVSDVISASGESEVEPASTSEPKEVRADFAGSADELIDTLQWGDADAVEAEADAEVERLSGLTASAEEHAAEVTALIEHIDATLALLGTDAGDRADAAQAGLEHAGDHLAALADHAVALRELAAGAAGSGAATDWTPFLDRLEAYAETLTAAQTVHNQRVAEIEAQRLAEEAERQAEAERLAEADRNRGGGGGSGGGGGGGGNWCPEVNWTGYIILVPC